MFATCGILTPAEAEQIVQGLLEIGQALETGNLSIDPNAEDIHTFLEAVLQQKVGPIASKLRMARSRNDQVVTDVRLWLKEAIRLLLLHLHYLQEVLVALAGRHLHTIMPGLTHQQHAQPVSLAHHLLAYFWMLERDFQRLWESHARLDLNPLGACALAGTSFPIDRDFTTSELGFADTIPNSMDAVSDRDFIAEFLFDSALLMVHLSRLAQELILWSTPEYGFVTLDDAYTTGSSLLPHKKNPDIAELIRGRSALAIGNLTALLSLLKGLPLTYNRDLQEDKGLLFATFDFVLPAVELMAQMIASAKWNKKRMKQAVQNDDSTASELANYLVRKGISFQEAHQIVGRLVRACVKQGKSLGKLTLRELQASSPRFEEDALTLLDPMQVLRWQASEGGTAPSAVRKQIRMARKVLKQHAPFADS